MRRTSNLTATSNAVNRSSNAFAHAALWALTLAVACAAWGSAIAAEVPAKSNGAGTSENVSPLILQIRVVEGEGETYGAGSRAIKGITVEITDEAGQAVRGAAVSFRLPEEGPSGLFQNGTRTEIASTGPAGRASVWGMKWNRLTGGMVVRITAAKGETRAGALVKQNLMDATAFAATVGGKSSLSSGGSSRGVRPGGGRSMKRWILVTALGAAAAAGGGLALGPGRGGTSSSSNTSAGSSGLVIGSPVIVVGK